MPRKLKWTDTEDLAILLHEKMPQTDPLTVRFTDLHKWVLGLEDFGDDPKASNEAKLEAIQSAWNDEYRESKEEE
ncbi:MAG TPA: Fe-S cluster assembly protein IscX [Phycisphaerae bacterium]|nr:Fe-S cluster assembly protein IscX [Phycisphaerae bacterium]